MLELATVGSDREDKEVTACDFHRTKGQQAGDVGAGVFVEVADSIISSLLAASIFFMCTSEFSAMDEIFCRSSVWLPKSGQRLDGGVGSVFRFRMVSCSYRWHG